MNVCCLLGNGRSQPGGRFKTQGKSIRHFTMPCNTLVSFQIASPRLKRILAEGSPTICDYLNEDCLVEVFSYLDLPTVLHVAAADPRFANAVRRRFAQEKEVTIDENWLSLPHNSHMKEFYVESSKVALSLNLRCVPEETVVEVVPYYRNLEFLSMSKVRIDNGTTIDLLPFTLQRLHLDRCHIKQTFLINWFEKLSQSLWELHFLSNYIEICFDALPKLKQIQKLMIDGRCFLRDNLKEFLDVNNAHLRHFELRNYDGDIDQNTWTSLTEARRLNVLVLDIASIHPEVESRERGIFPELERFHVQVRLQYTNAELTQLCHILDSFGCEDTLKVLSCAEVRGSYITKFKNLEELEVQEDFLDNFTCLLDLRCLKRLRFVVLNYLELNEADEDLLTLIMELPLLNKLVLHECLLSDSFFDRLKTYLASANRFMEITSTDVVESTAHLKHRSEIIIDMISDDESDELVDFVNG